MEQTPNNNQIFLTPQEAMHNIELMYMHSFKGTVQEHKAMETSVLMVKKIILSLLETQKEEKKEEQKQ